MNAINPTRLTDLFITDKAQAKLTSPSAIFEIQTTDGGFLPPRMTGTQRDALTPAEGMIIYNLDTHRINYYDAQGLAPWKEVAHT